MFSLTIPTLRRFKIPKATSLFGLKLGFGSSSLYQKTTRGNRGRLLKSKGDFLSSDSCFEVRQKSEHSPGGYGGGARSSVEGAGYGRLLKNHGGKTERKIDKGGRGGWKRAVYFHSVYHCKGLLESLPSLAG